MRVVCVGEMVTCRRRQGKPNFGVDFFSGEEQVIVPHNTIIEFARDGKATIVVIASPLTGQTSQFLFWIWKDNSHALHPMGTDANIVPFNLMPFKVYGLP